MKKIGILYGKERSFPEAFIQRVNNKNVDGIIAEPVAIDKVMQAIPTEYAVIIDRISQDVPFYRAYLKNAAATGTHVINNPFWWSADEKFFNNVLAEQVGVPVPKTVLLPSKDHPDDTSSDSFSNLVFPLDWSGIFEYIGFPAFMKPFAGGGWKNVYKVLNEEDFFSKYNQTGQLVMMLQEEIEFDSYFRCYCIGRKHVRIMHYEPRNPHHLRYRADHEVSEELMALMESYVLQINEVLGYDFNTVELAIRDGIPYAIDFCNPAPDAAVDSVGEENFEWVVETAASYAIERAQQYGNGQPNLAWGQFIQNAVQNNHPSDDLDGALNDNGDSVLNAVEETVYLTELEQTSSTSATMVLGGGADRVKKDLLSLIGTAASFEKDNLQRISGIGPKLEEMLNDLGICTFTQVSKMGKVEYDLLDALLNTFKGRGRRDDWAGQAMAILAGISYNSLFEEE